MKLNVFNLKQALIAISISLGALVNPAESKPGIKAFAFEVGRQTGSFYYKGIPMESAMEKGMMAAALEMDMPMAQVNSMDLESDKAAAALIDGIFDIAIHCYNQWIRIAQLGKSRAVTAAGRRFFA